MMTKLQIRKELIVRRNAIESFSKSKYDRQISEYITNCQSFKEARQILLFAPTGSEFDTAHIAEASRKAGKLLYYPKCTDRNGQMKFFLIDNKNDFVSGMYGILEPRDGCPEYFFKENDLIIVPALSVDRNFIRIGYGKGYYDRFLKDFHGKSICPCYDEMRTDTLPADEFDIKVDFIATQSGLHKRRLSYE